VDVTRDKSNLRVSEVVKAVELDTSFAIQRLFKGEARG